VSQTGNRHDKLDIVAPPYSTLIRRSRASEFLAMMIPLAMQRNLIHTGITPSMRLVVLICRGGRLMPRQS